MILTRSRSRMALALLLTFVLTLFYRYMGQVQGLLEDLERTIRTSDNYFATTPTENNRSTTTTTTIPTIIKTTTTNISQTSNNDTSTKSTINTTTTTSTTTSSTTTISSSKHDHLLRPLNRSFQERFSFRGQQDDNNHTISEFNRKRYARLGPEYPLKITLPIFVASLPKSGTSSLWKYFLCGGHMAAHTNARVNQTHAVRVGECIQQNIIQQQQQQQQLLSSLQTNTIHESILPFDGCGPYTIWSDAGVVSFPQKDSPTTTCFYPSIHALEELMTAYPTMTIILMRRNTTEWAQSVSKFHDIANRWTHCNTSNIQTLFTQKNHQHQNNNNNNNGGMPQSTTLDDLTSFYEAHAQRIRNYAKQYSNNNNNNNNTTITVLEFPLEGHDTGKLLESTIGIPSTCWQNCAPGKHLRQCAQARRHRQRRR